MTFYQFVKAVESNVQREVASGVSVSVHTAQKNNGVCRKGISLSERGSNISPTIYLEEYYRQFQKGYSVEDVVQEILLLYRKIRFPKPWKEEALKDYPVLKNRILYRIVNRQANRELLKKVPSVPYLNLSIVFHVLLEINTCGIATMPVRNEHLMMWKVTCEEIYKQACQNTQKIFPCDFKSMRAMIAEFTGVEDKKREDEMYVLSNEIRSFGAAAILYPGCLEKIRNYLGEDYYVLPSSVHEVIIVRKSAAPDKKYLNEMVSEINESQVEAEEVLSDNAYFYSAGQGRLSL